MRDNRSQFSWMGGLLACAAVFFLGRSFFPSLLRTILTIAAIGMLLIVAIIAVFVIRALQKSNTPEAKAKKERDDILAKGRSHLVQLRSMTMTIKDERVRAKSSEVCSAVDSILKTLKSQPEDIPAVRQFFNYYLPTMGKILTKFVKVEQSVVPMGDMAENALSCLGDIKKAMERQYANLFEDDMLDLSVEMEALSIAVRRDGLIPDEGFEMGAEPINLTL